MEEVYGKQFETFKTTEYYDYVSVNRPKNEVDDFSLHPFLFNSRLKEWVKKSKSDSKIDFEFNKTNTLCGLEHKRLSVYVVKNEDKITLKYFLYKRIKRVGDVYYKITTNCSYVSYNIKKNCLYVGKINNFHKKRKVVKSIKVCTFTEDIVGNNLNMINVWFNSVFEDYPDKKINISIGHDAFKVFLSCIPNVTYDKDRISSKTIHKTILTTKGIKLCDNWGVFSGQFPQPKTIDYKKNGPKYLDSIMKLNRLSGDKIKRVLHKVARFNPNFFNTSVNFFGKEFILSQTDDIIRVIFEAKIDTTPYMDFSIIGSKKERHNIFEIFKLVAKSEIDLHTFSDHMVFIKNIRRFEHIKWNSTTYDEFREEHLNLTELNQYYTKGTFKRIYGERFEDYVLQPIKLSDHTYFPTILKTSNDYNSESFVQSNCVKGYIQRADSLIFSLRKDTIDSKERVTIEYRISMSENLQIERVQTRGRFNQDLENFWNVPLEILDKKISETVEYKLFELPKIVCKVGNREFISNSIFNAPSIQRELNSNLRYLGLSNSLVWENNNVINLDYSGNDLITFFEDDLDF